MLTLIIQVSMLYSPSRYRMATLSCGVHALRMPALHRVAAIAPSHVLRGRTLATGLEPPISSPSARPTGALDTTCSSKGTSEQPRRISVGNAATQITQFGILVFLLRLLVSYVVFAFFFLHLYPIIKNLITDRQRERLMSVFREWKEMLGLPDLMPKGGLKDHWLLSEQQMEEWQTAGGSLEVTLLAGALAMLCVRVLRPIRWSMVAHLTRVLARSQYLPITPAEAVSRNAELYAGYGTMGFTVAAGVNYGTFLALWGTFYGALRSEGLQQEQLLQRLREWVPRGVDVPTPTKGAGAAMWAFALAFLCHKLLIPVRWTAIAYLTRRSIRGSSASAQ